MDSFGENLDLACTLLQYQKAVSEQQMTLDSNYWTEIRFSQK